MAYEYTVQGKVIALEVDPTVVAVRFEEPMPNSMRAESTARAGVGPFATRFEVPGEKLTIVPVKREGLGPLSSDAAINRLNAQPEVRNALPVFHVGGNQVVASDRVIVGVKLDDVTKLEQKYQLKTISQGSDKSVFILLPTFLSCARSWRQKMEFATPSRTSLLLVGISQSAYTNEA